MAYTGTLRQIDEINRQIKKLTHKKTKLMECAAHTRDFSRE